MPYPKCENHYKLHTHAPKLVLLHRGFVALRGACAALALGTLCRTISECLGNNLCNATCCCPNFHGQTKIWSPAFALCTYYHRFLGTHAWCACRVFRAATCNVLKVFCSRASHGVALLVSSPRTKQKILSPSWNIFRKSLRLVGEFYALSLLNEPLDTMAIHCDSRVR